MNHFFAIEIQEDVREEIAEQVAKWSNLIEPSTAYRWVDPLDYHITLLFLGDINGAGIDYAIKTARSVAEAIQPFKVTLAPPGVFRKEKRGSDCALWLGVRHTQALLNAASQLRVSVASVDIQIDKFTMSVNSNDQSYKPHITIGRGAFPPEHYGARFRYEQVFPSFNVDHFVLMETLPPKARQKDRPVRYNTVHTFPLGDTHS